MLPLVISFGILSNVRNIFWSTMFSSLSLVILFCTNDIVNTYYMTGRRDPKCNFQLLKRKQGRRRLWPQLQEASREKDRTADEGLQVICQLYFFIIYETYFISQIEPSTHEILPPWPAQILLLHHDARIEGLQPDRRPWLSRGQGYFVSQGFLRTGKTSYKEVPM